METNLIWINGHNGNPRNEEADKWAKISLELEDENYPNIEAVKFRNNFLSYNGQPIHQNISDIVQKIQKVLYLKKLERYKSQKNPIILKMN